MNKAIVTGRLCKDIELRTLPTGSITTDFLLAVDRRKKEDGADFISCVAWGKTAELLEQYTHKGDKLGFVGRIATRDYTNKDGVKQKITEVIIEDIEFLQPKQTQAAEKPAAPVAVEKRLTPSDDDSDLPF